MKIRKYLIGLFLLLGCTLFTKATSSFLTANDEVEIDKDITMTINLSLIDYDIFELIVTSNQSLDTLSSNNVTIKHDNDEAYFEYNINASELKKLVLTYKLPSTVNAGDKITFYVRLINKENEEEMTDVRKTVTVIDSKANEDEKEEEEKPSQDNKPSNNKQRPQMNKVMSTGFKIGNSFSTKKVTYPGSDNNYLSSLSVKGYSFNRNFSKDGLTYFVTVKNNVKSLKITAKKDSSKSKINISGNSNFKVGMNKVLISVTSESGRVRQYKIYVTREEE